jgi:hypothetical protein
MLSIFHTGAQFNQPIVARIDTHLTSTVRHSSTDAGANSSRFPGES